jgi:hypothetical protein
VVALSAGLDDADRTLLWVGLGVGVGDWMGVVAETDASGAAACGR